MIRQSTSRQCSPCHDDDDWPRAFHNGLVRGTHEGFGDWVRVDLLVCAVVIFHLNQSRGGHPLGGRTACSALLARVKSV